jgi:hypothetical protein
MTFRFVVAVWAKTEKGHIRRTRRPIKVRAELILVMFSLHSSANIIGLSESRRTRAMRRKAPQARGHSNSAAKFDTKLALISKTFRRINRNLAELAAIRTIGEA